MVIPSDKEVGDVQGDTLPEGRHVAVSGAGRCV